MYLQNTISLLLALPRFVKSIVALAVDIFLCLLTVWLAFYLRLGEFTDFSGALLLTAVWSVVCAIPVFTVFGLYRAIFRYSGWLSLMTVTKAIIIYSFFFLIIITVIGINGVPRTVGLIQPMLLLLMVGASRAFARLMLGGTYLQNKKSKYLPRVLIYGAGMTGRQLAVAMSNNQEMKVVGFLDDDCQLHGHSLNSLPIYNPEALHEVVSLLNIETVLLAFDSITRNRRNQIIAKMQEEKVSVRTLPSVTELAQGKISTSDLRELDIDDLLGREPVNPDTLLLQKNIKNKIVLVTGAGGSIGSELCRQILSAAPTILLLIDQSEYALYQIHQELGVRLGNCLTVSPQLIPILVSVRDEKRLSEILSMWKPDTIYHAAAYKHVPLVEHNAIEGIRNNVFGTLTLAQLAIKHRVSNFVLISTDKAVRPTNVMGASKRLAEMILQGLSCNSSVTNFCMVRFGNVLDSSGSVVPKFRQQIRDGGPITLTHTEITRYFMTIPEAAQLVIQAGAMAKGGEVFVLDMGSPVRIIDLARRMVELSGLTLKDASSLDGDIEVEVIGLRPGEKLYEELLIGDNPEVTVHPRIMKAKEDFLSFDELVIQINALQNILNDNNLPMMRDLLKKLVSGYQPNSDIVDWLYITGKYSVDLELVVKHSG